jgi:iduronate 2-sulfatase
MRPPALLLLLLLPALTLRRAASECSPLPCQRGLGYPGNDLHPPPGLPNPHPAAGLQGCALACYAEPRCLGFTAIAQGTGACAAAGGCCLLKSRAATAEAVPVAGHCSAILRADPASLPPPAPPAPPPPGAPSVLHIIVDDLRPQLAPWAGAGMRTPRIAALAASGTTFTRAYAAIAVCSPSRMSFLTGRLPSRTRVWNFMNSIRQATCTDLPGTVFLDQTYAFLNASSDWGGAGQCCTFCQADAACAGWVYKEALGTCHLKRTAAQRAAAPPGTIAGLRGTLATRAWTTLPQNFLNNGYSALGAGKVFHADNGGAGPAPFDGSGQPPLQDPLSWSRLPNATMGSVNSVACSWPCEGAACAANASAEGVPGQGVPPLTDKVTGDDGLAKLRAALAAGPSHPFYLAVGFRKPHLPFRAPAPYQDLYPPATLVPLARFQTLDRSVPPIAYHASGLWGDPYHAMPAAAAQRNRLNYWAAISWMDHQVGVLLDALEAAGRANDTLVVFHSDHGYSLGEGGSWEKFTNFEYGARVPLIIRAPWVSGSAGRRTDALAELSDLYPTLMHLAGVPLPPGEALDGASLVPAMQGGPGPRPAALSVYPRCPADTANTSAMYASNDCCTVERSAFFSLGVSLRTDAWRYTEWLLWNGSALAPQWEAPLIGAELYNHSGDDGSTFDGAYEVINLASDPAHAGLRAQLSAQLRAAYARGTES